VNKFPIRHVRAQQGLTLLEILIALLVLAIGMAGLGALMLTALTNVQSASQFSLASAVSLDFEERLWYEVAHRSATNPGSLSSQGCLTDSQIREVAVGENGLVAQWTAEGSFGGWEWTSSDRFRAPGLDLEVDFENLSSQSSESNSGISWQIIPFTVQWTETRFGLQDDQEQFNALITIVCRPVF